MLDRPKAPFTSERSAGAGEILYSSATTRVFRPSAGQGLIYKEYLGPHAGGRLRHERAMLERLAGIDGAAQLAQASTQGEILALTDDNGTDLAQVLRAGKCDMAMVLPLAIKLSRIVADVHRAGVIHLDINPANIVLSRAGEPVLIDYDLAVLAEQRMTVAQDGQIVGTLGYVAPEQSGRTGRAVDQRSDLYALGATLYELATGSPAFDSQDMLQLIHDQLVREPAAPVQLDARVPPGLSQIIVRLLATAPERRYQSAEGLVHDLTRLCDELAQGFTGNFILGERDFPARLAAPEQLVGRDAECAQLEGALTDAIRSSTRAVLIEGAAGVGKSELMRQLRPMAAAAGGWFVHGKFDQYHRDGAAVGGFTQALRMLGRLLLAKSADEVAPLRERILERTGLSGGLITRILPEFALLLGPQPDASEVDPQDAELQLRQAMMNLLGAVASAERPLVIVLDDLQWAPANSLRMFDDLVSQHQLPGVLLVTAYRTDEMDDSHALAPMLARWHQHDRAPVRIALANLGDAGMSELVGTMLRLAPERASELARAVKALTGGNPFDTVEMINALRKEHVLHLGDEGWHWDEVAIRRFLGDGDVMGLLAARLAGLPILSREVLEFMSCLGNSMERRLVAAAAGLGESELQDRLRGPLEDGWLVPDSTGGEENLRFRHDRIQQAVLGAMPHGERVRRQLAMARRLALEQAYAASAAQQYLACLDQVVEPEEQLRAAQLFYALALNLASIAIHEPAERYLAAAQDLLIARADPADADLRSTIDVLRHAALYNLDRLDECDALYEQLKARSLRPLELVDSTCLQLRSLDSRWKLQDARRLGVAMLTQLGLHVPADYGAGDIDRRLDDLGDWVLRDAGLDHAKRPRIQDPRVLAIAKVLGRMVRPASFLEGNSGYAWLLLESQRLWAEHGPCPELVATLGRMSGVLISLRQDYRTGFAIARHALLVGEALGYEPQSSEARFVFSTHACQWFEPVDEAYRHAARAFEGVLSAGDISYACHVHRASTVFLLETALTIDACAAEIEVGLDLCRRTGNMHAAVLCMGQRQLLRALRGQTLGEGSFDDAEFDEASFESQLRGKFFATLLYGIRRAHHAALLGDKVALGEYAIWTTSQLATVPGYPFTVDAHLFIALASAWRLQQEEGVVTADTARLVAELEACRLWFVGRSADNPGSLLHLLCLVEAEQAWAAGDFWKAAADFDAAVLEVGRRQRPWRCALINERAGLFHMARGMARTGRWLLTEARNAYQAWGASAKVSRMHREHAFLETSSNGREPRTAVGVGRSARGSDNVSSDALELMGVLRASQALSSETSLDRLTDSVSEVLASLTGATKVCVLSWNDGQWWLLAPAPGEAPILVADAASRGLLPLSALVYAERTREPLLVDDALGDDRFARDACFAGQAHCSLLLVPIAGQGASRAMLYLENRHGRAAFNTQRLDAVMLIAGQLAVSLANAQLYENLERRVEARTCELEQAQSELINTARRAGKAEIANNVLHNVGNVLNSVNVSASAARRALSESRVDGLARAVGMLKEHRLDLARFFDIDPRGAILVTYLDELVGELASERRDALADLDRVLRSVDHISYVVATQQSHAGPSSMLETAQPEELLEEALRLSALAIDRCELTVVRHYAAVPASSLDRQRLLQVLVNLVSNAAQAMEGVPQASRQLTLSTDLVRQAQGACLRMSVRDEGEGITAENLKRLFAHGFTTREGGHGFGLHSSALAAMEMGGRLTAHSDGPGCGAVFTVELPLQPDRFAGQMVQNAEKHK